MSPFYKLYALLPISKKEPEIKSVRSSHRIANNFIRQTNGIYVKLISFFCSVVLIIVWTIEAMLHFNDDSFLAATISRSSLSLSFQNLHSNCQYSIINNLPNSINDKIQWQMRIISLLIWWWYLFHHFQLSTGQIEMDDGKFSRRTKINMDEITIQCSLWNRMKTIL